MKFLWGILIVFVLCLNFVSSAHYIVGYVNDALDGESANDKTVLLWNPAIGLNENIIGVVGPNGDAMQNNLYMFDCEELTNGCSMGDVLGIRVVDNGDSYVSHSVFVNITVAGYDFASNITLNSLPSVVLHSPIDNFYGSSVDVDFNCSFSDLDYPVGNLSLFGNFSGFWQEVDRYVVGNLNHIFSEFISEGIYSWSCVAEDNLSIKTFGENRTLIVDITNPSINFFELNDSSSCGNTSLLVICNTEDNFGLDEVLLEVGKPSGIINVSMDFVSGNYTKNLNINEVGNWDFRCISKDNAGNYNFSDVLNIVSYSGFPELYINNSNIFFDQETYFEGESVKVSAYVENIGCVASSDFNVSFFRDSIFGNQLGLNQSVNLDSFSGEFINLSYFGFVGRNNIFVFADRGNEILEYDENNNLNNNSFSITLWQKFYGNVSGVKILQFEENFTSWSVDEGVVGNVFVADSEAIINWLSLKALGRTIFDGVSLDDFVDVDILFGTTDFEDSISKIYLEGGVIEQEEDFFIHKNNITHVPIVNTTATGNFVTGILWDSSDDSGDNEFSQGDREDLVFVTKLNNGALGENGIYDYEIEIPVELRSYDSADSEEVYLYYDLI
jgi:hypothetical protein